MYFHGTSFFYSSDSLSSYLDNDDYLPVQPKKITLYSLHSTQLTHGFVSAKLENRCSRVLFFFQSSHSSFCFFFCFVLSAFVQACQLLLQQQQQQPQQQQQQLLQNQRKFTPNVRQQADPQQVRTTYPSLLCCFFTSSSQLLTFLSCFLSWPGSWRCCSSRGSSSSRSGV